jgi:type VI secretion system protein ImpH
MGRETDAVDAGASEAVRRRASLEFLSSLAAAPYQYDFYQALRRIECLFEDKPRLGRALRPVDEPIRLGQDPELSFAPAPLASCDVREGQTPRLQVRLFGLLGPNGPLPLHITEYARERLRNAGDPTLSRFLDVLHHRFLSFFYQAWAQAQPHVSRDRPEADRFAVYIGAFLGAAPAAFRHRDDLPDEAKLFHVGMLVRGVRNAEGLAAILRHFFGVPVEIEEFVGHWLELGAGERTYLGREGARLGSGAVLGQSVWDRQSKFRVRVGPLDLNQYESFLPGREPLTEMVDWVRLYLGFELDWDVHLVLRRDEVPVLRLGGSGPGRPTPGQGGRLGWTTWLGSRRSSSDADDLCLDAEASIARFGVSAS